MPEQPNFSPEYRQNLQSIWRKVIEKKVLAPGIVFSVEDVSQNFASLDTRQRTDLFYEKLMAWDNTQRVIKDEKRENPQSTPEPPDPYLMSEMKFLWSDPKVQEMFLTRFTDARIDLKQYKLSELGINWQTISSQIAKSQKEYNELNKALFLEEITRPDKVDVARSKIKKLSQELVGLRSNLNDIVTLKGLPEVSENTDVSAQIMYDTFKEYAHQAREGFVWLPSRRVLYQQTVEGLQNGRWPYLVGEAGTGKSELADEAAYVLTGEQPTHIGATSRTSERDLTYEQDIDPNTSGGYEKYKPMLQAFTGFEDSRQKEPKFKKGRICRVDESARLGDQGYADLKEYRQKRPANPKDIDNWKKGIPIDPDKLMHGLPVLPGAASTWCTNPPGPRYPDRAEPDPAMERELARIKVDYPSQKVQLAKTIHVGNEQIQIPEIIEPELYEFMVATLLDENYHLQIAEKELAPAYEHIPIPEAHQEVLPDGTRIVGKDKIIEKTNDPRHGTLYRLSFAVRALQDAFNYGNTSDPIPDDALRYTIDNDGKIKIADQGGDPLTLSSSTITLGEVGSWMKGFRERFNKDDAKFHVNTLTEFIKLKLETYLSQINVDDKEKIQAIFEYYHLFDNPPTLENAKPLTPKEIGYLSPRVKRPVEVVRLEPKVEDKVGEKLTQTGTPEEYQDIRVVLEDGSSILVKPESLNIEGMKEE